MENYMPYILVIALISLVLIRVLKMKRYGLGALKLEIIYLIVYSFFGGVLFAFFLVNRDIGWIAVLILFTFLTGFMMRLYALFRELAGRDEKGTQE